MHTDAVRRAQGLVGLKEGYLALYHIAALIIQASLAENADRGLDLKSCHQTAEKLIVNLVEIILLDHHPFL